MITQCRLKELLHYNRDTGGFTWVAPNSNRAKAGFAAGHIMANGYIRITIDGKRYFAHRLAWLYTHGYWPKNLIDHINGNPSDNRIENLREATNAQNLQNQRCAHAGSSSQFLGVSWHKKSGKWQSNIKINGKKKYLGLFPNEIEARRAYLLAKRSIHLFGTI